MSGMAAAPCCDATQSLLRLNLRVLCLQGQGRRGGEEGRAGGKRGGSGSVSCRFKGLKRNCGCAEARRCGCVEGIPYLMPEQARSD